MVSFREATKAFRGEQRTVTAVDHVSLDVERGEIFGIIGYSGAGKSTLVRLVNALEKPTSGSVVVDGQEVSALSETQLRPVRAKIGMIFQQFNLFTSRTVADNVGYPLELAGWSKKRRRERVAELLDFVDIGDKAKHYPSQLSGGQKQRVGIARALATSPDVLLADEATSALDPETTRDVLELLQRVNRELGITILLITHEMDVIRYICDHVAVMESGRVVEQGTVYDVFSAPKTPTAQRFVGTVLRDKPSPEVIGRLREKHTGRLVTIAVDDQHRAGPEISRVVAEHGVSFEVVYGGISELQERSVGSLTLEFTGDPAAVEAAVDDLRRTAGAHDLDATEVSE